MESGLKVLILTGVSAVVLSATAASAEGLWEGPYIGANAGWSFLDGNVSTISASAATGLDENDDSFTVGGHIGLNVQSDDLVFGIEADFNSIDLDSHVSFPTGFFEVDYDWLATVRARAGMVTPFEALGSTLLYLTGGVAFMDADMSAFESFGPDFVASKRNSLGWVIGAGAETMFAAQWSGRVEYLYVDFESQALIATPSGPLNGAKANPDLHILRAGLSYHF